MYVVMHRPFSHALLLVATPEGDAERAALKALYAESAADRHQHTYSLDHKDSIQMADGMVVGCCTVASGPDTVRFVLEEEED